MNRSPGVKRIRPAKPMPKQEIKQVEVVSDKIEQLELNLKDEISADKELQNTPE